MKHMNKTTFVRNLSVATAAAFGILVLAQPTMAAVTPETAFVFNTFSFLIHGVLVMFMAAGFAMLESGLVRKKNTAAICLKNISLYGIAGIMFYLIGYNIMYPGDGGWTVQGIIGKFALFYDSPKVETDLIGAKEKTEALITGALGSGYSVMSDWFFQMVFVATTASIVSGTVAERIKIWPFLIFTAILTAIIYPIIGSWEWGGGWLNSDWYKATFGGEFVDFAGSTLVHSTGGWAALAGAIMVGARKGKFGPDGKVHPMPGANLPLATLGTFILWFGWFGFNGGSQLALGSAADAAAMSNVYVNTNLAAASGVVIAMLLTQTMYGKVDLTMALNGAIGGLVAITAGPDVSAGWKALIVGGVGGALVVFAVPMFDKMKIDDVVGALSAHLVAGIWGTIACGIFVTGNVLAQVIGVVAIGVFVFIASLIVWGILKAIVGLRVSEEDEDSGLDISEVGMEAYPEFGASTVK